jgi:hypothetical protein
MKRLVLFGVVLLVAACAQQAPPPAAPPPPPQAAAAPPPPPPPPPPVTLASFDGRWSGQATVGPSGVSSVRTNPICPDARPMKMSIRNGYVTISYRNWRHSLLHYRGRVDPTGKIYVSHLNGDGSRSIFTMQITGDQASGQMQRGDCWYSVDMTRA